MLSAGANWPVPDDLKTYLIDVDVLARIHVRRDSAAIYDALIEMARHGRLRTVRQTFDELKKFGPQYAILKPHRDTFQISLINSLIRVYRHISRPWAITRPISGSKQAALGTRPC